MDFCMLGKSYSEKSKIQFPCIATEKLDGVRRLLFNRDTPSFFSRNEKEDIWLSDIRKDAAFLPKGFVYDGELLAIGTFENSMMLRQATTSLANRKSDKSGLTFNVFDMLPIEEYNADNCQIPFIERRQWIEQINLPMIKPVPVLGMVSNIEEAYFLAKPLWEAGKEGIMLNSTSGLYRRHRSHDLIKIKNSQEFDLIIIDMIEGKGKYVNRLGALVCTNGRDTIEVGTGFDDIDRWRFWKDKEYYIGRIVEIESFGVSTNRQGTSSLNCPVFKRLKGEE